MIRLLVVAIIVMAACKTAGPPPPPAPLDGLTACVPSVVPNMSGLCEDRFTLDNYACFTCVGINYGCLDVADQVYCSPNCKTDPHCGPIAADNLDGGVMPDMGASVHRIHLRKVTP